MPLGHKKTVSTLYARVVLCVILLIMAWGQYHTTQQLSDYHDQAVKQRTALVRLATANHRTLLRIEHQIDQKPHQGGTP